MRKTLPPLGWIRAFESAARHLSFTHAAEELSLTQAAISHQIKGLENHLGSRLFIRLPRGLSLTDAGLAYLPAVHESVERLKAATQELFSQEDSKLLTVKVNMVFFMTWMAPRMSRFIAQHPNINLRITSNIWQDNRESSADSDMEIRYGHGKWREMQADRLTWDELFPVCSPAYLKANPPLATPDDLANHTLLHVIGYEEGWGYWLSQIKHNYFEIDQRFQFDSLVSALEMAVVGEGLALGRTSLVEGMIKSGKLVIPLEQKVRTAEAFHLVYSNSKLKSPQAAAFGQWLLEEIEQQ